VGWGTRVGAQGRPTAGLELRGLQPPRPRPASRQPARPQHLTPPPPPDRSSRSRRPTYPCCPSRRTSRAALPRATRSQSRPSGSCPSSPSSPRTPAPWSSSSRASGAPGGARGAGPGRAGKGCQRGRERGWGLPRHAMHCWHTTDGTRPTFPSQVRARLQRAGAHREDAPQLHRNVGADRGPQAPPPALGGVQFQAQHPGRERGGVHRAG
jgi:hypothetical protein